ncbi:hypothetical protein YC2023_070534 [Brassica napus]
MVARKWVASMVVMASRSYGGELQVEEEILRRRGVVEAVEVDLFCGTTEEVVVKDRRIEDGEDLSMDWKKLVVEERW